jgi:CubicO group peptidase (beta-lactamase class C family)
MARRSDVPDRRLGSLLGIRRRLIDNASIGREFVMRLVTWGVVALASLFGSTYGHADRLPTARAEAVGMSSERLERVPEWINRYVETDQIAGAVTLIARRGKVVHYEANGWRHKEADEPMPEDAIFTIMSMTKPIVSVALLMLLEEGRFLLDDPISKWLPEYSEAEVLVQDGAIARRVPAERPVTVRHVLTHTSGLRTRPVNVTLTDDEQAEYEGDGTPAATIDDMLRRASVIPLSFHPGDQWQYGSSTDYVALLVEKISGERIDRFLQRRIFDPLEMTDTHYYVPEDKLDRVAAVYRPNDDGTIELRFPPTVRPPTPMFRGVAGLSSTAADYFKFAQMLLNGGSYDGKRLLGRRTVEQAISNHIEPDQAVYVRGPGYGFGLGFGVLVDPTKSVDTLSRGSFTWGGAFGTLFWVDPVEELIGILMVQISPYSHFNLRPELSALASQAIVDDHAAAPKIMGHLD